MASGGEDGLTRIWDTKTGEPVLDLVFQYAVNGIAFTKDGKTLVTGTWGAQVWNTEDGTRKNHLESHTGFLTCVACSPDGKIMATGGLDSTVKLWDTKTWQEMRSLPNRDQVNGISFSSDGKLFAIAGDTGVALWNTANWKPKREIRDVPATCVAVDLEGKLLAVGCPDGTVRVLDASDGHEIRRSRRHPERINDIAFSVDGRLIVTAGEDKSARLLATEDLKEKVEWKHPQAVTSIAFAPDGKSVATGCKDKSARIWRVP